MLRVVLWFRMAGFSALFVAIAIAYLAQRRRPFKWLRTYLILLGAQALFDLSYTAVFVTGLFPDSSASAARPLYWILQALVGIVLLYTVPRFVQRGLGIADRPRARLWAAIPVVLVLLGYILVILPIVFSYDRVVTVTFYAYLGAWYLRGFTGRRRLKPGQWKGGIVTFFAGATLWHFLTALDIAIGPVFLAEEPALPLVSLTSSLFNLFWALTVIIPAARITDETHENEGHPAASAEFLHEYKLSRREGEIADHLCRGRTNREIAENLFISPRTVENHVYNLYRKCGVKRRLELCSLMSRYRSRKIPPPE